MHDQGAAKCVVINDIPVDRDRALAGLLLRLELFGLCRIGLGRFGFGS